MDNPIKLISGHYSASVLPFGAELCSLKHEPSRTEFIWQADKSIWPRHAPVLFPFVGRLKNFEYRYNTKTYSIEQHGFARDSLFTLVEQKEDCAVFELTDSAYTQTRYPFQFSLRVGYYLFGNSLQMEFEISNKGKDIMPVSFGAHPAFAIDQPEDAFLVFDKDLDPLSWQLDANFISNRQKSVTNGKGRIDVDGNTFKYDAIVLENLKSKWITLYSKSSTKNVKVDVEGWPYLGIWAKADAKFICIEPWFGIADSADFEGDVMEKKGVIHLPPYSNFKKGLKIEVHH